VAQRNKTLQKVEDTLNRLPTGLKGSLCCYRFAKRARKVDSATTKGHQGEGAEDVLEDAREYIISYGAKEKVTRRWEKSLG
jgi:hypothetical protein